MVREVNRVEAPHPCVRCVAAAELSRGGGEESGPITGTCSPAIAAIAVSMHLKCVTIKVKLSVRFC